MKIFALGLILFVVSIAVSCGGDDGDSVGQNQPPGFGETATEQPDTDGSFNQIYSGGVVMTEYGAHHEAIDLTPAIDPRERDSAYIAVARAIADFESYIPTPNRDLVWEELWALDDSARYEITGIFPDLSGEGEKGAFLYIKRTPRGFWIPDEVPDFTFTKGELNHRRDLERIVEYTDALVLFEEIIPTLISAEAIYAKNTSQPRLTKRFLVEVSNPTTESREVRVEVEWEQISSDPDCEGVKDESKLAAIEASTTTLVEIELSGWLFFGHCPDMTLINTQVWISRIDTYGKETTVEKLADLMSRTSP